MSGKGNLTNMLISWAALIFHSYYVCSLPNNFGTTALHWCASKGHEKIAELLIKNKADVNYVDAYGKTPLDLTAMHDNEDVAAILIKNGGKHIS